MCNTHYSNLACYAYCNGDHIMEMEHQALFKSEKIPHTGYLILKCEK